MSLVLADLGRSHLTPSFHSQKYCPSFSYHQNQDTAAGLQDVGHETRVYLQHQGAMVVEKIIVMWTRVRCVCGIYAE